MKFTEKLWLRVLITSVEVTRPVFVLTAGIRTFPSVTLVFTASILLSRHSNPYSTLTTTFAHNLVVLLKTGAGGSVSPSSKAHLVGSALSCALLSNNEEELLVSEFSAS